MCVKGLMCPIKPNIYYLAFREKEHAFLFSSALEPSPRLFASDQLTWDEGESLGN